MGGEMVVANKSSEILDSEFYKSYSIMVVDDDITCLSIIAAQLKKWKYQVVTVKHARDALCILRFSGVSFDVIVSDVHMPDMNGFELQRVIAQEFDVPVVFMSADDRDSMVLEGLERGAVFFLLKPISPDDLRDIWQYAALAKKNKGKGKSVVIEEIQENNSSSKSSSGLPKSPHENVESSSSINVKKGNKEGKKEESKKKSARKYKEAEKEDSGTPPKKTKLVWTDALHNKFLQAIKEIGLDKAYPRTILEVMDVPGLTRENVASHLQKYRIFLRKVTEESFRVQAADTILTNSATQSTFGSKGLSTISQHPQEISGSQQPFLKNNSLAETSNRSSSSLSNRRATPAITLPGYGKAKLVLNKGDSSKITSSNANQVSTVEAVKNQTRSLIHEDVSTQLLNAAILANQRITRNLNSLHNSSAAGEHHESNQSLVQRDSSLIGFQRDKEFAAMLTSYLNQGANRTQLTRLPNNVETGGGSGTVLDQDWSSYFNQGANRLQLTRLPNFSETREGSGTIPGQDCEGEKQSAALWSSYLSQGANRVQLTRFPNNFETEGGSGTKPGQDCEGEKQSAAMWSSYIDQGANRVQLTRLPNNFETGGGSGTKPGQDCEGEKQSATMWSSYFNQGANHMQLNRLPNNAETGGGSGTKPGQDCEGEKRSAVVWSSNLNQGANHVQLTRFPDNFEAGGGSGTNPGQDCEGEKQSAAMWSSYFNQGANSVQLTRFPNNFEAGGGSGTKPGQDGEGEKQSAAMWSSYLNQGANRVNQGEKQSEVVMWSSNLQLTQFPNNVETGGGSGTKLGQDYDVSMFDKNNATSYSSGIGDLTSTFYSQLNVQPFHVESSNNQEETTFNLTDVNNQDQEAYYPLPVDYTPGEQGDHPGVTAEEGSSSQLHHTHQNPELEHGDDTDFWDSLLSLSPYNGDQ